MEKRRLIEEVKTAPVSPETRQMLVIMAMFQEAANEFSAWCDTHLGVDAKNENEFKVIFEELYNCVEETLTDAIFTNMSQIPCKEI